MWFHRFAAVCWAAAFLGAALSPLSSSALVSADEPAPLAVGVEGDPFAARFGGIDERWNITFAAEKGTRTLSAADLVMWGSVRDSDKTLPVVLADGSLLAAERVELLDGALVAHSKLLGAVRMPLRLVRGVVLRRSSEPLERDKLIERVLAAQGDEDQVFLLNGDVLRGTVSADPDAEPPADADPFAARPFPLRIETRGGPVAIKSDQVSVLAFRSARRADGDRGVMTVLLGLSDGSRLRATGMSAESDGKLEVRLACGATFARDAGAFYANVTLIQPETPRVVYISDVKPLDYKHVPLLDLAWSYGADRNLLGGRLRSGGLIYEKGLAMHSASRLAYALPEGAKRFEAELALDDSAGERASGGGSVEYRVYLQSADGQWSEAYASPTIRGGDAPLPISLDVSDSRAIALLVGYADHGDTADHADWLSARIVK